MAVQEIERNPGSLPWLVLAQTVRIIKEAVRWLPTRTARIAILHCLPFYSVNVSNLTSNLARLNSAQSLSRPPFW